MCFCFEVVPILKAPLVVMPGPLSIIVSQFSMSVCPQLIMTGNPSGTSAKLPTASIAFRIPLTMANRNKSGSVSIISGAGPTSEQ